MKSKLVLVLSSLVLLLFVYSCVGSLPKRFESFVNQVEKNADNYTEEDWNRASDKFEKLMEAYEKQHDRLSKEDRKSIDNSIGRYRGLVLKSGIKSAIDEFNDAFGELESFLKGLSSGLESLIESLTE